MRFALAATLLAVTASPAFGPIEAEAYGPPSAWFCGFARDWKAVMRRDRSEVDLALPEVDRRCHLPREEGSR